MNQMSSKFKTLPEWLQDIAKFIIFILLWVMVAKGLIFFNLPSKQKPNDYFKVCVIEDNKPNLVILKKRNQLPLCSQNYERVQLHQYHFMYVKQIDSQKETDATEWEVTEWSDSMGDPSIFRYQVNDDKVVPLWKAFGGMMMTIGFWMSGLIFTSILWAIGKKIIKEISENY